MKITIYTMTHRRFLEPEDSTLYLPLHVGRALGQDLGYQSDNTGPNISAKNDRYGELTGVYWVWKNDLDSDIIGICHYRRFFVDQQRHLLRQSDYERLLNCYEVIVSPGMTADKPYLQYYGEAHNAEDLYSVGRAIKKLYPEDYPLFEQVLNQPKYYYGNLMAARRELFMDYAGWLFALLQEAEKEIDVSSYDLYNRRVFGFLSEQLLLLWITKNQLKVYECPVGLTSEKAETLELKLAVSQLVKNGEIPQARELFYEFLKIRPDVRLELSDIKGEIPVIEQLLYIMQEEQNRGIEGLFQFSAQLGDQIVHYHKVEEALKACSQGQFDSAYKQYFLKNAVSWVMALVILSNSLVGIPDKAAVLEQVRQFYLQNGKAGHAKALEGVQFT